VKLDKQEKHNPQENNRFYFKITVDFNINDNDFEKIIILSTVENNSHCFAIGTLRGHGTLICLKRLSLRIYNTGQSILCVVLVKPRK
jgi:hypothetical protein